jgi:CheY-like chemotaxis protein
MTNLLIIDDEEMLGNALQRIFSDAGYAARAVTSGEAALDAIKAEPPDMVVTDVLMPGMSGLQLLEAVRAQPNWAGIPFVFISASVTTEVEGYIATLDNVSYLRKPFEIEKLLEVVLEALAGQ